VNAIAIVLAALLATSACKKSTTADCARSIGKGVDQLRERRKQMMAVRQANLSPSVKADAEAQAKMMETFSEKLKATLTTRCTEDKWPAEVIDCYENTSSPDEMRKCRIKLSPAAAERVRTDEVNLMMSMTGSAAPPPAVIVRPPPSAGSADGSAK
jgi:hypothetical protein